MVVVVTLPPVCVSVRFEENEELSVETWNPLGAAAVMLPMRPVPLTVKDCAAEAVPLAAVKLPSEETEGEITARTVPLTETDWVVAPVLASVMLPEAEPPDAEAAMRA